MKNKIPISPDLNPIEMIFEAKNRKKFVQNLDELETAIRKENIDNCINHVQKRVEEIYEKKGDILLNIL